ncbi:MAG TPA: hypothetical protein VGV61_03745, partial [Thermoanaerobaculia bacterium]|jgi:hypothetical protein|nr:hypothetical protein [Thermoanaerobaculia bacterium]
VGVYLWLHGGFGKQQATAPPAAPGPEAALGALPAVLPGAPRPDGTAAVAPTASAVALVPAPSSPPAPDASPAAAPSVVPVPTARPSPPVPRATATPVAAPPRHEVELPRPTYTPAPLPSPRAAPPRAAPPPPPPPEAEPAEPEQRYDQEIATTLALKFKVEPDDAVVSFKGEGDRRFTVIGRAVDYNAEKKKSPAFDLPGAGTYYLRLYKDGREVIYKLRASPGPLPTTIAYVLVPKSGRH